MSANLWPVDAVSGAPSYTGRQIRQFMSVLLGGGVGTRLAASSGVPNRYSTVVSVTSTTYTVTPFGGYVDAETSAISGGYVFTFDTNQTGSIAAADGTNPRIDVLYVQVSDPAEGDGSSVPAVKVDIVTGTPATTPSAPSVPARSMAIAQITVPVSGGGSPSALWVAPPLMSHAGPRVQAVQTASTTIPHGGTSFTTLTGLSTAPTNGGVNLIPGLTNSAGILTIPTGAGGQYEVNGQVTINTPSGVTGIAGAIELNGTNLMAGQQAAGSANAGTVTFSPREVTLAAGDQISLAGYVLGTVNGTTLVSTTEYRSFIHLKRIA